MIRSVLAEVDRSALSPALALLPPKMDTADARIQLLATGLQESRLVHRAQVLNGGGKGPARGLWQFERGGGVKGVLTHKASAELAQKACRIRGFNPDPRTVWAALEHDDILAAALARLLLYTDPYPMPDSEQEGFEVYIRVWRPGAYSRGTIAEQRALREKWGRNYREAKAYVEAMG